MNNNHQLNDESLLSPHTASESVHGAEQPDPIEVARQRTIEVYALEQEIAQRALQVPRVELSPMHSRIVEITQLNADIKRYRAATMHNVAEKLSVRDAFGRVLSRLVTNAPVDHSQRSVEKNINQESIDNAGIFPYDSNVTSRGFVLISETDGATGDEIDILQYYQESVLPVKQFTNSYKFRELHVEKNSTYYDAQEQQVVNRSSIPTVPEMDNLLVATKIYHAAVTKKPPAKYVAPRLKLWPKSNEDLAA